MKKHGFTLTELLVVLVIIALLGLIFIPSFVRFYLNSSDPLRRTARELAQILQVARMYAITYRVNTAVVYQDVEIPLNMTNVETENSGIIVGTQPSLHILKSAAIMYEISSKNNPNFETIRDRLGVPEDWDNFYVPIRDENESGVLKEFGEGIVVCSVKFMTDVVMPDMLIPVPGPILSWDRSADSYAFQLLGLQFVKVPFLDVAETEHASEAYIDEQNTYLWVAHVFNSFGKLSVSSAVNTKERFIIPLLDISFTPSTLVEVIPGGESMPVEKQWVNHRIATIELFRSTGRIKINL